MRFRFRVGSNCNVIIQGSYKNKASRNAMIVKNYIRAIVNIFVRDSSKIFVSEKHGYVFAAAAAAAAALMMVEICLKYGVVLYVPLARYVADDKVAP